MVVHKVVGDSDDESGDEVVRPWSPAAAMQSHGTARTSGSGLGASWDDDMTIDNEDEHRSVGANASSVNAHDNPSWKSAEPDMSTSPLASDQQRDKQRAEAWQEKKGQTSEPQSSATGSDIMAVASKTKSLNAPANRSKASKPKSTTTNAWDVPSSDLSDYAPTAEGQGGNVRNNERGSGATRGPASGRSRNTKRRGVPDWEEEDENMEAWEPSRNSKLLEEPCNPRVTRRQGSAGLVEGLLKRKRPRKGADLGSGSGTEASVASKRARLGSERGCSKREPSQRPSSSAVIVDLTNIDTILSESQKLQYEVLSNGAPSSVECPQPAAARENEPLEASMDDSQHLDSIEIEPLDEPLDTRRRNLATGVMSASQSSSRGMPASCSKDSGRAVAGLQSPESIASQEHDMVELAAATLKTGSEDTSQSYGQGSEKARSEESQATSQAKPKEKRKRGRPPGKSKPVDCQMHTPLKDDVDRDALTEDIGLPPELYKPRPSRSRGVRRGDPVLALDDDNDAGSVLSRSRDGGEVEEHHITDVKSEVQVSKGKRGRPKKAGPSTTEPELVTDQENKLKLETPTADTGDLWDQTDRRHTKSSVEIQLGDELFIPKPKPSSANDIGAADQATTKDSPLKTSPPSSSSTNANPTTSNKDALTKSEAKAKKAEARTETTTPLHLAEAKAPLAESDSNTPSKGKGPKQSPLKDGRVPYRVGLSRRARIQPLLSVVKK